MEKTRYAKRGVSSSKEDVHAVVDKMDQGLFPGAFCKVTEDYLTGNPQNALVIHADGSGTKSLLAYLYYKEFNDLSKYAGIAQDSIVMNIDDLACIGVTQNIILSSTINRNAKNIPGEVLRELIEGNETFLENLRHLGINIKSGGGETADVGDLTGTVLVDSCAVALIDRSQVIDCSNVTSGLSIVGLSSQGQSSYEKFLNSGIGSNGLTSARHDLLSKYYFKKYPEAVDPKLDSQYAYSGPHKLQDPLPDSNFTVGEALLSPTRTYLPVIDLLLKKFRSSIKGIIHCSGGGQTKCIRFGKNIHFVKNNLMEIPPIFKEIQRVSQASWEEMFKVFNMGHRMEIYCDPQAENKIVETILEFGIFSQVVGFTETSQLEDNKNHITLNYNEKTLDYK